MLLPVKEESNSLATVCYFSFASVSVVTLYSILRVESFAAYKYSCQNCSLEFFYCF